MKIFGYEFVVRKKDKRVNHDFTEEDTAKSNTVKEYNKLQKERMELYREKVAMMKEEIEHQRVLQQQRHIEELMEQQNDMMSDNEEYEDEEHVSISDLRKNPDEMLFGLLDKAIEKGAFNKKNKKESLTDEQIQNHIKNVPKRQLNVLKKLSIEEQRKAISSNFSQYDDDTIEKALKIINN